MILMIGSMHANSDMTKKQARIKAAEALNRIKWVFEHNDYSCAELSRMVKNETLVLGLGRLMLQAAWQDYEAKNVFNPSFHDVACQFLYQHYRQSSIERKKSVKPPKRKK